MRPFCALAVARGVSKIIVADEFRASLSKPGAVASTTEFQTSTANAKMEIDAHTFDADTQLDRPFSIEYLKTALQTTRRRSATGPVHVTYSALANL